MNKYILQMQNITKSFNGVKALDNAKLYVRPGTVHALMGANGAGKSTLMKCLFGIYQMDYGEIIFNDTKVKINSTKEALNLGIAMTEQEVSLIPKFTVAENIFCGHYPLKKIGPFKYIDYEKMYNDTSAFFDKIEMNIDPKAKINDLSIAKMQIVAIVKALSVDAKLIILDEPTASLSDTEANKLFKIINKLKNKGISFIYISHKMHEILNISDEVTIMRDGRYIGTLSTKELTEDMIIKNMVGHEVPKQIEKENRNIGDEVLRIENFSSANNKYFNDISFSLRSGEILGIGGLVGAGRTELIETIFGVRKKSSGKIFYNGKQLKIKTPKDAIKNHFSILTENRLDTGIFASLSVSDNIGIVSINNIKKHHFIIDKNKLKSIVDKIIETLKIKVSDTNAEIKYLSGGNQQKALLGRCIISSPDILILDEPTKGIDINAKIETHNIILNLASKGKSIIMISSEMQELLTLSDRILVMSNGKLAGELDGATATNKEVLSLATKYL